VWLQETAEEWLGLERVEELLERPAKLERVGYLELEPGQGGTTVADPHEPR
jgi:hypothetical protein